jgi:hypothetical protein
MLAPIYGICDFTSLPWINYHRFARSLWCANFDPEFGVLRWGPSEFGVLDGTAVFSRLAGSVTPAEMAEALTVLRTIGVDDVTGSVFWWPRGVNLKRGLTRCSQGQGAWAWQYLEQWTGLRVDAGARTLTVAPRGFLTSYAWAGFASGGNRFDVQWREESDGTTLTVHNLNPEAWTLQAGFRPRHAGAAAPVAWQTVQLAPGQVMTLAQAPIAWPAYPSVDQAAVTQVEAAAWGDADGVLFMRYGPAKLWGHWDAARWFDPAAMPLTLRFIVQNGSAVDWRAATVQLRCPPGWQATARRPLQWTPPVADGAAASTARLDLGALATGARMVAPFWLDGPEAAAITPGWEVALRRDSFHMPSQPGKGLVIPSRGEPRELLFEARLTVETETGEHIERTIQVPVCFTPD